MSESGQQIRVFLPDHLRECLESDAKDAGERHIQPVIRMIIARHYADHLDQTRRPVADETR